MTNELCCALLGGVESVPGSLQRSYSLGLPKPVDILGMVERSRVVEVVVKVESVSAERGRKQHEGERLQH